MEKSSYYTLKEVSTFLGRVPYVPLTALEENSFIKRAKLSFYHESLAEEKAEYLSYYFEEFPEFKEIYEKANEEEREKLLEDAISNSLKYRNLFLLNNQRLSFLIARNYHSNILTLMDFIQISNFGLIKAIKKFDFSKDCKFATYATYSIRRFIRENIASAGYTIGVPAYFYDRMAKVIKAENSILRISSKACDEQIAQITGYPLEEVQDIREVIYNKINLESLDEMVFDEDEMVPISETIALDEDFTEDVINNMAVSSLMPKVLNGLDDREFEIIKMRYGLDGSEPLTFEEIGNHFNFSRQRAQKIHNDILENLRNKLTKNNVSLNNPNEEMAEYLLSQNLGFLDDESYSILSLHYGLTGLACGIDTVCDLFGLTKEELYQKEKDALHTISQNKGKAKKI